MMLAPYDAAPNRAIGIVRRGDDGACVAAPLPAQNAPVRPPYFYAVALIFIDYVELPIN